MVLAVSFTIAIVSILLAKVVEPAAEPRFSYRDAAAHTETKHDFVNSPQTFNGISLGLRIMPSEIGREHLLKMK